MTAFPNLLDQVILVDDQDHPVGTLDKIAAHRGEAKLHRAISVYLFRQTTAGQLQMLMQRRSQQKIVGAHQWANACCGNLRPGESYLECAERRLWQELGVIAPRLTAIYKFQYSVQCNAEFSEREIDQIYVAEIAANTPFHLRSTEVAETCWVTLELDQQRKQLVAAKLPEPLAPWFKLMWQAAEINQQLASWWKERDER